MKSIHELFLERICKPRVSLGFSVPFDESLVPRGISGRVFKTGDGDIVIYFPKEAGEGKYCDKDPEYQCPYAVSGKCKGYKESVCSLQLSIRARNALLRNGLVNIDDVKNLTIPQIMTLRGAGRKIAEEVAIRTSVWEAFPKEDET